MVASSAAAPWPSTGTNKFSAHFGPISLHVITNAASLHLGNFLRRRFQSGFLLPSSSSFNSKYISYLGHLQYLRDAWHERAVHYTGSNMQKWSCNVTSGAFMSSFFSGGDSGGENSKGTSQGETPASRFYSDKRKWTETLIGVNILAYVAQVATGQRLLMWGGKINSLIARGQVWRLITCAFLHVNLMHLLINCYSLSNIGPAVENFSGSRRYLTVYMTSAVTGSVMSYFLQKSTSVGASGAIFGLVGANAVFVWRHKEMIVDSDKHLWRMMQVLAINAALGYFLKGIDNWGHIGGFLGGVAASWLLGPALKLEYVTPDGRRVFTDKPPIAALLKDTNTGPTDRSS